VGGFSWVSTNTNTNTNTNTSTNTNTNTSTNTSTKIGAGGFSWVSATRRSWRAVLLFWRIRSPSLPEDVPVLPADDPRHHARDARAAACADRHRSIGYEITHVKIALIHFCAALAMSLPNIIRDDASDGGDDIMQVLLGTPLLVLNVVLIYSIHILPVLVQRLNRAELYNAIAENQRETA